MTTIHLIPRGKPDQFAQWADSRPKAIIVERETLDAWLGKPVSNPCCPTLTYPKFAWESVNVE